MARETDPVLRNSAREAVVIALSWVACTTYCCVYCYLFGYIRDGHPLGVADVKPVLGVPSWFFWGVLAPWAACAVFTFWFAGFRMADDDLGKDRAGDLDADSRQGGGLE